MKIQISCLKLEKQNFFSLFSCFKNIWDLMGIICCLSNKTYSNVSSVMQEMKSVESFVRNKAFSGWGGFILHIISATGIMGQITLKQTWIGMRTSKINLKLQGGAYQLKLYQ